MADSDIAVTSLVVTGGFGVLTAQWTYTSATSPLPYLQLEHFEVWVASFNNRASATLVAEPKDLKHLLTGLGYSVTRYFWIRPIDRSNNAGDFYPLSATGGVGAATKSQIDDTDILPNSLPGSVLQADSISTRELRVTNFTNLILNPQFLNNSDAGWTFSSGLVIANASSDRPAEYYVTLPADTVSDRSATFTLNAAVAPGQEFFWSVDYETSGTAPRDAKFYFRFSWVAPDGTTSSSTVTTGTISSTAWATLSGSRAVPAGVSKLASVRVTRVAEAGSSGSLNVTNFVLKPKSDANLYVEGSIEGRHVKADTMSVDKLEIGARKFAFEGIRFEFNDPATNRASWTAGIIRYIDDANAPAAVSTSAGSTSTWSSGVIYIYWIKGDAALSTTTSSSTAFGTDRVVLATYRGGKNLAVTFGKFTIDGALDVKIESLIMDRLGPNAVTDPLSDTISAAFSSTTSFATLLSISVTAGNYPIQVGVYIDFTTTSAHVNDTWFFLLDIVVSGTAVTLAEWDTGTVTGTSVRFRKFLDGAIPPLPAGSYSVRLRRKTAVGLPADLSTANLITLASGLTKK